MPCTLVHSPSDDFRTLKIEKLIDHTVTGGFHRIRRHLAEAESDEYLSGNYRARIIK